MAVEKRKSYLSRTPAWTLSIITAVVSLFIIFFFAYLVSFMMDYIVKPSEPNEELSNLIAYLGYGVVVAIMCYFICKAHPTSFWYTPIICNAMSITSVLVEQNPSITLIFGIGWGLSVIGTVMGTLRGKRGITNV